MIGMQCVIAVFPCHTLLPFWPETDDQLPLELITGWNCKNEIAAIDELMLKGL